MRHPTRTLTRLAAVVLLAPALTACSPVPEAWLAVTVEDGEVVVVVRTCDTTVVEVEVLREENGRRPATIDTQSVDVGPDRTERAATGVPLDALDPGVAHSLEGGTDDVDETVTGLRFTRADLLALTPGEVLADAQLAPDGPTPPTSTTAQVTEDDLDEATC